MTHTGRCSGAKTDRCKCSCNGALHGGSAVVATTWLVTQPGRTEHHSAMSRAQSEIRDWLAGAIADPPGSATAVTEQAIGAISDSVASAIVDALNSGGYRRSAGDHVLCDFLAAAACMMQKFQDQFERGVAHMVSAVLTSRAVARRSEIPKPLAELAAQAAVDALMNLSPARHFDDLLRAVRISAISFCPDPTHHDAVVRCCLSPLEKGVLSDAVRQELTDSLPRGWMTPR
jgi:hypothetical protein